MSNEKETSTMEAFGTICFTILALITSTLLGGYVFMTLYKWFVITAFNAPNIGLAQSIGLMTLISFIRYRKGKEAKKEKEESATTRMGKMLLEKIGIACLVLGIGWIVTLFL